MQNKHYLALLFSHVLLGLLIFYVPFLAKIYGYAILGIGIFIVVMTKNKNNEVLYICSYIVGSEVFLRMTDGSPNHEFGKYSIIVFMLIGIIYSGFSKLASLYWLFLADFPAFFWRLATLTHFMGVATLYVATLTVATLTPEQL